MTTREIGQWSARLPCPDLVALCEHAHAVFVFYRDRGHAAAECRAAQEVSMEIYLFRYFGLATVRGLRVEGKGTSS